MHAKLIFALSLVGSCAHAGSREASIPEAVVVQVAAPTARARNAILIVVDSLGQDVVTRELMPNLTAFARDGVSLEGRSTATWAKPAVAGILTGVHPEALSMSAESSRLPVGAWTLPRWLGCAEFASGSFIANGYISRSFGFAQGWDRYTNYIRETSGHRAQRVFAETTDWIREQQGKRFFAYVHLIDTHLPYDPPAEFAPEDGGLEPRPHAVSEWLHEMRDSGQTPTDEQRAWVTSLYEGEVRYVDHAIGRFVAALRQGGTLDDTLVVVTSDHREIPGDPSRLFRIGNENPDPSLAVPLIYVGPGAPRPRSGPVETIAIARHLLAGLGVAAQTGRREFGVAPQSAGEGEECSHPGMTAELCDQLQALGYGAECVPCIDAQGRSLSGSTPLSCD